VSRGKVPTEALVIILDSFLHYISELNDFMLIREVTQNVFRNLLSPLPDLKTLEAKFQASQKVSNLTTIFFLSLFYHNICISDCLNLKGPLFFKNICKAESNYSNILLIYNNFKTKFMYQ